MIDRPARALDRAFSYRVPDHLVDRLQVGHYVLVPFGRQQLPGFVVGLTDEPPPVAAKDILGLLIDRPMFDEPLVALARWLAERYLSTLTDALRLLLPPGGTRKTVRTATATELANDPAATLDLNRAPRQQAVLVELLRRGTTVALDRLLYALQARDASMTLGALETALAALQNRGLAIVERDLQPPQVRELQRQVVRLLEQETDWDVVLERLQTRAPRQAEVIAALLATEDGAAAVSEFSRPAVKSLCDQGLVVVELETQEREPEVQHWEEASVDFLRLNPDQQLIYSRVGKALQEHRSEELLLHGVTGSGKTEVYLHCADMALNQGRTVLILVPEIALTPQMVGRFRARFGKQLALLHSALSLGERFDEWNRALRGEARIVIGARSAIFAPLHDVGLIVVDEEHENAYKQEQPPRYHAVEVARQRARMSQAVLILGSATPTVEHYHEACCMDTPLQLVELPERVDERPMPEVRILDLRKETLLGRGQNFSQELLDAIAVRLAANEQIILFLNRRGFSPFVICRECGYVLRCPDCEISLTYHHHGHALRCHHCDYARHVPDECPSCQGTDLDFNGLGTERLADQIEREFPEARVARMDRDTIGHKGAHGRILQAFAQGEANVLVGTQMIAKGHDFPGVTLVGVLNADTGLHRPDFRAAEHTFQILTQVAGRAGRADKPGEVLIQTYNPGHYAILAASGHDYRAFYAQEIEARSHANYPPFTRLARLVVTAEAESVALAAAQGLARIMDEMGLAGRDQPTHYAGPAPAPLHKLRGRYRYSILLAGEADTLNTLVAEVLKRAPEDKRVSLTVDVDPVDMM